MRAAGAAAHGVVVAFDAAEGLGVVRLDGGDEVAFHATELVDGTRAVDVGREVDLVVVAWHRGRLEAGSLRTAGAPVAPGAGGAAAAGGC